MSLQAYLESYQQLGQLFRQLQATIAWDQSTHTELKNDFLKIQQAQQQIVRLEAEFLDQPFMLQIQAIQTEIYKQLRLLDTDLLFLKAARQSTTMQERKQQMQNRLELLMVYCTTIANILVN